ncbi:M23 family metallopeptidase [Blastococcus saxobsidens]|uniref:Metalloendopeptidase-like membrane protein (Modular protein) n=1 Tax=Blastococcus saxobsidens (strain DD2) TaxID=1146883 RepID=H6RWI5_BLASD|nr:M23 family metallopeptidase [Blastococcus saxobsidens]CCG04606.1 Metalloendopeptidase-like membrane protein (modular protein) [Blastococcus saxobsidens DD2]
MRTRLTALVLLASLAVPALASAAAGPVPVTGVRQFPAWAAPLLDGPTVTRPFEAPAHRYGPGHRGADLAGTAGTPVLAAGDGIVVFAGMVAGRPVVSVNHAGGLRTTYEPVRPSVGAGERVERGAPLGALLPGHEGCPADACLHWGARRGEDYLDPLLLLRPPRVRLLPFGDGLSPGAAPARASGGRPPSAAGRRPLEADRHRQASSAAERVPRQLRRCRRAWCAGAAPPWCAAGRSGSRSLRAPGRCRRA